MHQKNSPQLICGALAPGPDEAAVMWAASPTFATAESDSALGPTVPRPQPVKEQW
jgi:hypothetical protein